VVRGSDADRRRRERKHRLHGIALVAVIALVGLAGCGGGGASSPTIAVQPARQFRLSTYIVGTPTAGKPTTIGFSIVQPDGSKKGEGRVVLLGDACHPMTPYMAQGAATAIKDAAVLARCLDADSEIEQAFKRYEQHRKPRTSRIQAISSANTWQRTQDGNDPDWLYGYDAWNTPLS